MALLLVQLKQGHNNQRIVSDGAHDKLPGMVIMVPTMTTCIQQMHIYGYIHVKYVK